MKWSDINNVCEAQLFFVFFYHDQYDITPFHTFCLLAISPTSEEKDAKEARLKSTVQFTVPVV